MPLGSGLADYLGSSYRTHMIDWVIDWLTGCCLKYWLVDFLMVYFDESLSSWSVVSLIDWIVSWLIGWIDDWLVEWWGGFWLIGRLIENFCMLSFMLGLMWVVKVRGIIGGGVEWVTKYGHNADSKWRHDCDTMT